MGYRAGLHVLSPEPSRANPPFRVMLVVAGAIAGVVVVGTLAKVTIMVAKGAGDAFTRAWTGSES